MTEPVTYNHVLPRDLQVGQRIRMNVPVFPYRYEMDCEIVKVEKFTRDRVTTYEVTIIEPRDQIPNVPFGQSPNPRRSKRVLQPGRAVLVVAS